MYVCMHDCMYVYTYAHIYFNIHVFKNTTSVTKQSPWRQSQVMCVCLYMWVCVCVLWVCAYTITFCNETEPLTPVTLTAPKPLRSRSYSYQSTCFVIWAGSWRGMRIQFVQPSCSVYACTTYEPRYCAACMSWYGVAMVSRIDKTINLFCQRAQ